MTLTLVDLKHHTCTVHCTYLSPVYLCSTLYSVGLWNPPHLCWQRPWFRTRGAHLLSLVSIPLRRFAHIPSTILLMTIFMLDLSAKATHKNINLIGTQVWLATIWVTAYPRLNRLHHCAHAPFLQCTYVFVLSWTLNDTLQVQVDWFWEDSVAVSVF